MVAEHAADQSLSVTNTALQQLRAAIPTCYERHHDREPAAPTARASSGAAGSRAGRAPSSRRSRAAPTSTGGWRATTSTAPGRTPASLHAAGLLTDDGAATACSTGSTSSTGGSQQRELLPQDSDEDVHGALEGALVDAGRSRPRRQAARRAQPQRPDRHAVQGVPARPRPGHRRLRCSTSPTRSPTRPSGTSARSCRAARTSSTPSRCCSATT